MNSELKTKAINLYVTGELTTYEVAKQIGLSRSVIERVIRAEGVSRGRSEAIKLSIRQGKYQATNLPNLKDKPPIEEGGRVKWGKHGDYVALKLPSYPRADSRGYVPEHIYVWEQVHKRSLPQGWVIHHVNGIKGDNRPRNLLALPVKGHHSDLVNQELKKRIRELEIENRQLVRALEDGQMLFTIAEN